MNYAVSVALRYCQQLNHFMFAFIPSNDVKTIVILLNLTKNYNIFYDFSDSLIEL